MLSIILYTYFSSETKYLIHKIDSYSYNSAQKNGMGCFPQFPYYLSQFTLICSAEDCL